MKTFKTIAAVLLLSSVSLAVDGKSLLIGIGIGLGLYTYQGTRQHVILPATHKIQRTIRPIPQDKIEKENRRALKAAKRAAKAPQSPQGDHHE